MTIIVTGAGGALGSSVARHLAARSVRVAAIDSARSKERVEKLAAELGNGSIGLAFDVASSAAWADAMPKIEASAGPAAGAVLVAGAWRGGKPLHEEADDATYRAMLGANLETVDKTLRAVLPGMVARRSGSVVVIGSRAVERPWTSANASAYAATKAAVVALAQAVAAEVLESGVRVNAVLPSTIDTPANRSAMPGADSSRWVKTESLAEVIAFLLSSASRDVSGAAIPVYGRA